MNTRQLGKLVLAGVLLASSIGFSSPMTSFTSQFIDKLSYMFGGNVIILYILGFFFITGLVWATGLPKALWIPMVVMGLVIVASFSQSILVILGLIVGIGIGLAFYLFIRGG